MNTTTRLFRDKAVNNQLQHQHGNVILIPKLSHAALTTFFVALFLLLLTWLIVGEYTHKQTAYGWVEPKNGVLKVYSQINSAIVEKVLVSEGQLVSKGEPLLKLSRKSLLQNGEYLSLHTKTSLINQKKLVINEIGSTNKLYDNKVNEVLLNIKSAESHKDYLDAQTKIGENRHKIRLSELLNMKKLKEADILSETELLQAELNVLQTKQELSNLEVASNSAQNKIEVFKANHQSILVEREVALSKLQKNFDSIRLKIKENEVTSFETIRAIDTGIISNLQLTKGQMVNNNYPLLTIIPKGNQFVAKIVTPVKSSGFINKGQELRVKFDAFPFQKFGLYKGVVRSISDSILLNGELESSPISISSPSYLITADLEKNHIIAYNKPVYLKSGMTFMVDIEVETRTILEWALEPLLTLKGNI